MAPRTETLPIDSPHAAIVAAAAAAAAELRAHRELTETAFPSTDLEAALRLLDDARQQLDSMFKRTMVLERRAARLERALSDSRKLVFLDELTGLPNRRLLLDHYKQAVARAARQGKQIAVLLVDLDSFKHINVTLGSAWGDALLRQVAARLLASVRASDTAARFGGGEFVVLLPELESRERALTTAAKVRERLAGPYLVDGVVIETTASVGVAVYPGDSSEFGELLRLADRDMYRDRARHVAGLDSHAGPVN